MSRVGCASAAGGQLPALLPLLFNCILPLCERLGILDVWHHYKRLESGSQAYAEGSDAAADADGVLLEAASSPNACLL